MKRRRGGRSARWPPRWRTCWGNAWRCLRMSWGWVVCDPTRGDRQRQCGAKRRGRPRCPRAWALARCAARRWSPTVRSGDRCWSAGSARRPAPPRRRRPRAVPARPELLVVKRVAPGGRAAGTGSRATTRFVTDDSRAFGVAVVVGRVVGRLWPRPGRLPARRSAGVAARTGRRTAPPSAAGPPAGLGQARGAARSRAESSSSTSAGQGRSSSGSRGETVNSRAGS